MLDCGSTRQKQGCRSNCWLSDIFSSTLLPLVAVQDQVYLPSPLPFSSQKCLSFFGLKMWLCSYLIVFCPFENAIILVHTQTSLAWIFCQKSTWSLEYSNLPEYNSPLLYPQDLESRTWRSGDKASPRVMKSQGALLSSEQKQMGFYFLPTYCSLKSHALNTVDC